MEALTYTYEFSFNEVISAIDELMSYYQNKFNANIDELEPIVKTFIKEYNEDYKECDESAFSEYLDGRKANEINEITKEVVEEILYCDRVKDIEIIIHEKDGIIDFSTMFEINGLSISNVEAEIKACDKLYKGKFFSTLFRNTDTEAIFKTIKY